jgi:hypothetical protein
MYLFEMLEVCSYWQLNFESDIYLSSPVEALRACLRCLRGRSRDNSTNFPIYKKIWREIQQGFKQKDTSVQFYASLLALGELLEYSGDFLEQHYKEIAETVVKYK